MGRFLGRHRERYLVVRILVWKILLPVLSWVDVYRHRKDVFLMTLTHGLRMRLQLTGTVF